MQPPTPRRRATTQSRSRLRVAEPPCPSTSRSRCSSVWRLLSQTKRQ
jgi:hypothetical protein